jgi:HEPN domain-containing protein
VNSREDVEYRLNLAKGFLQEAEDDFELKRWRACVDSSQLVVENSGKAILMLFGVSPKTHEPAKHLVQLVGNLEIPKPIRTQIKHILPDFIKLGIEEHFMTDYGDETSYRLPWDIFDEESALSALEAARMCRAVADEIIDQAHKWRSGKRI